MYYNMKKTLIVAGFVSQFFLFTSYVSAETLTVYGSPQDGTILSAHQTSWSAVRDGGVGNAIDTEGGGIDAFTDLFDSKYNVTRAFFVFDTSALPDNAEILDVTAHIHATLIHNDDNDENAYLGLYQGFQNPAATLTLEDFDLCADSINNPTLGASIDIDNISVGNYFVFNLNDDGKSWISKDGYTPLCVREGHDAENDPISYVQTYTYSGIRMKSADMAGTGFDPYLEITYTIPDEEEEFPLYTQGTSTYPSFLETTSWANDSLAGGTAGPHCPTIAACGCAITSAVMLARSYGITKGIDGSDVNPGNFNQWLTTNSGYRPGGNLDFSQAIKYFGTEENGVKKSYFKWKEAPLSGVAVRQKVSSGVPVVSQMKAKPRRSSTENERRTHFVLVTEPLGVGQYGVNDPIWYNTNNLDDDANRTTMVQDYNDQIINGRDLTFVSTAVAVTNALSASLVGRGNALSIASFVRTTALLSSVGQVEGGTAPAEMFMVTPSHERLGIDPRTGQNHTLATGYYGTEAFLSNPLDENAFPVTDVLKTLSASELTSGTYRVIVVGTGGGSYTYSGLVHDSNGREHPFTFTTETAKGMVDTYEFTVETGEVAVLPIDLETFNQVIDGEITDATLNKFFKMWADKIMGEIAGGKTLQAKQHIETFRTLLKAKKVNSPAINLLLKKLEAQIG